MAKKQTRNKQGQFQTNRSAGVDNAQARTGQNRRQYALTRLYQRAQDEGKANIYASDAQLWMKQVATKVRDSKSRMMSEAPDERVKAKVRPGRLYYFQYDAKTKEDLPYWDALPIIFPFWEEGEHFLGLNMHYLPNKLRATLMDKLLNLANDTVVGESSRLIMSYQLLNASSKYKEFKPCVKKYRKDHVKSRFIEVPATEWYLAIFLPLQSWRKGSAQKVYADSRKIIKKVNDAE